MSVWATMKITFSKNTNVLVCLLFSFTTDLASSWQSSTLNADILKQVLNRQSAVIVRHSQVNISAEYQDNSLKIKTFIHNHTSHLKEVK